MSLSITDYLRTHGPNRSSAVAEALMASGLTAEAARQRVSRAGAPVMRFPIPLLPKREAFLYLVQDRNSERFWTNFARDLRLSSSVYGACIDGMIARGGYLRVRDFATVSGAPARPVKAQVASDLVAQRLVAAGFMKQVWDTDNRPCYALVPTLAYGDETALRARDMTERVILDGIREWARKIGLASYNSIRIRGDAELVPVGPFQFDLAGPSYLLPLQGGASKPGFMVADVFSEGVLTAAEIQFFIRKARMLKASLPSMGVLSMLVAEGFTGEALTAGHAAGVMLATPKDLFGKRVGAALTSLVEVLKNAARYASSEGPERLQQLLDNLFDIEGRSRNLRGVLFELIAGYLARRDAMSIDMNIRVLDPESGKPVEIDIQKVTHQASEVTAIECKGREPGGSLSLADVEAWLSKIARIRGYYRAQPYFREAKHRFEIWTSGTIDADALALLEAERLKRSKAPIDWKDGQAVLALARAGKEKGIADALNQHFLVHPYAEVAAALAPKAEDFVLPPPAPIKVPFAAKTVASR